jgi:hypothetical protein
MRAWLVASSMPPWRSICPRSLSGQYLLGSTQYFSSMAVCMGRAVFHNRKFFFALTCRVRLPRCVSPNGTSSALLPQRCGSARQLVDFNSPPPRTPDSSSRNAVSFSSARTTKRFPSSQWASAIKIVRPLESIAETQPQLQPDALTLSAKFTSEIEK